MFYLICIIFRVLIHKIKADIYALIFSVNCPRCNRGLTLSLFGMHYTVLSSVSVAEDAEDCG